ncbi:hypothetical protein LTR66_015394, partial [Elasticomyces elasticus]
ILSRASRLPLLIKSAPPHSLPLHLPFPPLSKAKPDYYVFITDLSPTIYSGIRDREAWLAHIKLPKQSTNIETSGYEPPEVTRRKVTLPVGRSGGLVDLAVAFHGAAHGVSRGDAETWARSSFKPSAALLFSKTTLARFQEGRVRIEGGQPSNGKSSTSKKATPGSISSKSMVDAKAPAASSDRRHDEGGTLFLLEWDLYAKGAQDFTILASRHLSKTEVTWQWK